MNVLAYTAFDTINGTLNQLGFYLDSGIKISDFTTTLAIVISIITLLISLKKDRDLRSKEQSGRNMSSLSGERATVADSLRSCATSALLPCGTVFAAQIPFRSLRSLLMEICSAFDLPPVPERRKYYCLSSRFL